MRTLFEAYVNGMLLPQVVLGTIALIWVAAVVVTTANGVTCLVKALRK